MEKEQANEIATGAPGTVSLNGETYLVSQPTVATFMTVRQWIRKRLKSPLEAVAPHIKHLPPELQAEVIKHAVSRQESGSELTDDRLQAEISTPEGTAFLLWLLARPHHPETTPKTFLPHLTEDNVFGILADLLTATRLEDLEGNGRGATGSPTESHPTSLT